MDLKTRAPFFYGAEKQTACLKRTKQSGSSLFPPAWLTLTSSRLVFQGFGYGRRTPLFYRSASPLSICLGSVLQWGLTNCRRWILLATAALCFFGTPALLVAFPSLSPLWRVLLILDLALLAPAILLARLFFLYPLSRRLSASASPLVLPNRAAKLPIRLGASAFVSKNCGG